MKLQTAISFLSFFAGLSTALVPADQAVLAVASGQSCSLPSQLEWKNDYNFKDGNGHSEVLFYENGEIKFRGRFHATTPAALDYAISCGLRDSCGNAFHFSRRGTMPGSLVQGNRDSTFEVVQRHDAVHKYWAEIVKSGKLHCSVKTNVDVKDTLREVNGLLGQYGPISGEIIIIL